MYRPLGRRTSRDETATFWGNYIKTIKIYMMGITNRNNESFTVRVHGNIQRYYSPGNCSSSRSATGSRRCPPESGLCPWCRWFLRCPPSGPPRCPVVSRHPPLRSNPATWGQRRGNIDKFLIKLNMNCSYSYEYIIFLMSEIC